jgi:hypothetical protein
MWKESSQLMRLSQCSFGEVDHLSIWEESTGVHAPYIGEMLPCERRPSEQNSGGNPRGHQLKV